LKLLFQEYAEYGFGTFIQPISADRFDAVTKHVTVWMLLST